MLIPKKLTANNIGIEIKKEIFDESYLLNFRILETEIAIPDLLTPGIRVFEIFQLALQICK